ncbi:Putative short-chain dehydrogenase/reductase SDR, NAD(P)-binding domain superfamily [Septoria linicola]|uniref:Short-chain dehydrogenase/reductase 3 n=1 Tax=Septoria linicola TaxID=215465 RepID=A0A9Q9EEU8_9PEZI|nr:putative short-chain dehydrogenase/reductase SDR, NAD(P)-binding domain superfamily [Septoria linicola]USW49171.1 Putative short-chain dehydrogenase/reductase SDR, NAD(P)-binding domain superfamily [Septoria linicola]
MAGKLLTPAVTGALLFALTSAPDRFREPLLAQIRQYLSPDNIARLITSLKWLVAIGVVSDANKWLSELAQNNFRLRSEKHRYHWPQEVAVITGATGGFGSLMSKDFASRGVNVMALDIRDELPADMKNNPKIHYFKCNVTDRKQVAEVARQIREQHGDPSILINNAGISSEGPILEQTEEGLRKVFDINIISHYYTVQEFLPAMTKNKKGHVVTIASMAAFATTPGLVPYSNTKVAAWGFHEGLQQETRVFYNAPEVKFSCVHPSFAATPMVAPFKQHLEAGGARIITAESVADAVVKQVVSGRGKQIILAGNLGAAVWLRSLPLWMPLGIFQSTDKRTKASYEKMLPTASTRKGL